jgi:hypothetical protein
MDLPMKLPALNKPTMACAKSQIHQHYFARSEIKLFLELALP